MSYTDVPVVWTLNLLERTQWESIDIMTPTCPLDLSCHLIASILNGRHTSDLLRGQWQQWACMVYLAFLVSCDPWLSQLGFTGFCLMPSPGSVHLSLGSLIKAALLTQPGDGRCSPVRSLSSAKRRIHYFPLQSVLWFGQLPSMQCEKRQ